MAEIWLARRRAPGGADHYVALKFMRPELASRPEFVTMFLDEVRISTLLRHPNIVRVYDVGEDRGTYFLAMEYLRGADLSELVRAGRRAGAPLLIAESMAIVRGACAGLHYAHERVDSGGAPLGLVHRDVSPGNVIVTFEGCVKVVDFGVAKALTQTTRTRSGVVKGKVCYMAPEQLLGRRVDRRADVYGLGAMLYELTTGCRPFSGATDYDVSQKILDARFERPRAIAAEYPAELEDVVLTAMASSPGDRFPCARSLGAAIGDAARRAGLDLEAVDLGAHAREVCGERAAPSTVQTAPTVRSGGRARGARWRERPPASAPAVPVGESAILMSTPSAMCTPAARPARSRRSRRGRLAALAALGLAGASVAWIADIELPRGGGLASAAGGGEATVLVHGEPDDLGARGARAQFRGDLGRALRIRPAEAPSALGEDAETPSALGEDAETPSALGEDAETSSALGEDAETPSALGDDAQAEAPQGDASPQPTPAEDGPGAERVDGAGRMEAARGGEREQDEELPAGGALGRGEEVADAGAGRAPAGGAEISEDRFVYKYRTVGAMLQARAEELSDDEHRRYFERYRAIVYGQALADPERRASAYRELEALASDLSL